MRERGRSHRRWRGRRHDQGMPSGRERRALPIGIPFGSQRARPRACRWRRSRSAGCSYHTVRKWLARHGLSFTSQKSAEGAPLEQGQEGYRTSLRHSSAHLAAIRAARSGSASNFWRGGRAASARLIAAWTTHAGAEGAPPVRLHLSVVRRPRWATARPPHPAGVAAAGARARARKLDHRLRSMPPRDPSRRAIPSWRSCADSRIASVTSGHRVPSRPASGSRATPSRSSACSTSDYARPTT